MRPRRDPVLSMNARVIAGWGTRGLILLMGALLLACSSGRGVGGGGGDAGGEGGGATVDCDVGSLAIEGACSERCPAGEWPDATGACLPAGVPAVLCSPGFVHDGDVACEPILPTDVCPPGQLAVPGDETCREVAPCGSGTWGDIPVEGDTVYVQAGASGGDGSSGAPFGTIGEGVDAAGSGAIVAVAEGVYSEDVLVSGKAVKLWGRCPGMVEIVGQGEIGAVFVREGGSATEVHDLAITGPNMGILASAATELLFSRVHVHDTGSRGIDVEDPLGPVQARVVDSLFENNVEVAWYTNAGDLTVERSLARDVQYNQGAARGANAQPSASGTPSTLTIIGSVIERVPDNGVLIWGSYVTLEGTVIRDVAPNESGDFGAGIDLTTGDTQADLATLTIRGGLIERSHSQGIASRGGAVDIEGLVVRDIQPEASTGFLGRGIDLGPDNLYGKVGLGNVRWSLVENSVGGFQLGAGEWVIAASRVRNTYAAGELGAGMIIQDDPDNPIAPVEATVAGSVVEDGTSVGIIGIGALMTIDGVRVSRVPDWGITIQSGVIRGSMSMVGSLVEDATRIGINALGAEAVIEDSFVRRTAAEGIFGRGINVQWSVITTQPGTATIRRVQVQDSNEVGVIVYGGDAYVEDVWVRGVATLPDGSFGDGVDVLGDLYPSTLSVSRLRVDGAERAGVATFGRPVAILDSTLTCNGFDLNTESTPLSDKGTFENLGGNRCGCDGELGDCKVLSANLEPPAFAEE